MAAVSIRPETAEDAAAIRRLTAAAFDGMPYSAGTEATIVDALRAAGALALSLVAIEGDEVVGHVAFSPVTIDGAADGWFGLGPLSVLPGRQRAGIGTALVKAGLDGIRAQGAPGCVVLGNPAYYGRFGFANDPRLRYPDAPAAHFQRMVLAGPPPSGVVAFHAGFSAR